MRGRTAVTAPSGCGGNALWFQGVSPPLWTPGNLRLCCMLLPSCSTNPCGVCVVPVLVFQLSVNELLAATSASLTTLLILHEQGLARNASIKAAPVTGLTVSRPQVRVKVLHRPYSTVTRQLLSGRQPH